MFSCCKMNEFHENRRRRRRRRRYLLARFSASFYLPCPCRSTEGNEQPSTTTIDVTLSDGAPNMDLDMSTLATYVVYFTAGFVLLPAGRDIVSHKTAILPGETDMRKAMTMTKPQVRTFMWGVWVRISDLPSTPTTAIPQSSIFDLTLFFFFFF